MERLISDASKMTDIQKKLNVTVKEGDKSFGNIVNAISVMQEQMGIAGTTAEEAKKTISGSFNSMKAAWTNLLTGFADENAGIGDLLDDFIKTVQVFGGNLLPRINLVLKSVADLIKNYAPQIIQTLPEVLGQILPPLISMGKELIMAFLNSLIVMIPDIIKTGVDLLLGFLDSFAGNIDKVIDIAISIIEALIKGLLTALPKLYEKGPQIIDKLVSKLTAPEMIDKLIQTGISLIVQLTIGLIKAIPKILEAIGRITVSIAKGFGNILKSFSPASIGKNIVKGLWEGISNSAGWLAQKIKNFCSDMINKFKKALKIKSPSQVMRDQIGVYMAQGIGVGFTDELGNVYSAMSKAIDLENAKLQSNVETGKVFNTLNARTPVTVEVNADVEMDNQKVGRLVAPSVVQTIQTKGGY